MTPFMRNVHRTAVAVHLAGLVLFAWLWTLEHHWAWAAMCGWAAFYGSRSWSALRKFGKDRGGE